MKRMFARTEALAEAGKREVYFGENIPPHRCVVFFVEHFYRSEPSELWLVFRDHGKSLRQLMYVATATSEAEDTTTTSVIFSPSPLWFKMRRHASTPSGPGPPSGPAPARMFRKILYDILLGAAHLQQNGIVHRDIKPSNVFCHLPTDPKDLEKVQCVLGDFSSGVDAFTLKNYYSSGASKNELTLQYSPPEVLFGESDSHFENTYDSWSVGVLALEVMLGTPDVFSVDQRTTVLLSTRLRRGGASDEEVERALILASFADFCIYDHEAVVRENMWPVNTEMTLNDNAMVASRCDLGDFRKALLARDQLQKGFSTSSEQLLSLIWQLLQYNPQKRLLPTEALQHPYFTGIEGGDDDDHRLHPSHHAHSHYDPTSPTSFALEKQSTETTIEPPNSDEPTEFKCPLCGKTYDAWNSCHQHVTKRKHGNRCQYIFGESSEEDNPPFTCLSAHSLLPLDESSGYCDIQGRRSVIEDFHSIEISDDGAKFYGVFDGHNGNLAAKFAAKFLISEMKHVASSSSNQSYNNQTISTSFANLNSELLQRHPTDNSGSTATVAVKLPDQLFVANIGDSRAILCSDSGFLRQLTVDHNPSNDDELKRILEAGGEVASAGGVLRVGGLAVSRSFGDSKVEGVISKPHTDSVNISAECPDNSACFAILATDGLWDVVSNGDACTITNDALREVGGTFQDAAQLLTLEAWVRGSKDNIGVCVVDL